jgi:hypothetical protein
MAYKSEYGIIITAFTLDPGDEHYLLLLFALYVPSGVILFLLGKLHSIKWIGRGPVLLVIYFEI